MLVNRPRTREGWEVWAIAERLSGQMRAIPGAVLGLDLGVGLALGAAMGVPPQVVAEFLPGIERAAVRAINAQLEASGDGG